MDELFLIGRIIFGGYFIFNGVNHFAQFGMVTVYAKSKKVPAAPAAVAMTGLMLLLGGASIVLGAYPTLGVALLVAFLVPVAVKMHDFWKMQDAQMKMFEMVNFTKNLALAGAALMVLAIPAPWPLSVM